LNKKRGNLQFGEEEITDPLFQFKGYYLLIEIKEKIKKKK